jgi:hypothetical protein
MMPRLEDNIGKGVNKVACKGVKWIQLAQN